MPIYQIWKEGYIATGESEDATFLGVMNARSFNEACILLAKEKGFKLDKEPNGDYRLSRAGHYKVWACELFDNEKDAKAYFG